MLNPRFFRLGPLTALAASLMISGLSPALAQGPARRHIAREAYTNPDDAGEEYLIQGEYLGRTGQGDRLGAQVVDRGDGRFDVYFLAGGLPGAGWNHGEKTRAAGTASSLEPGATTTVSGGGWSGEIRDGIFQGSTDKHTTFRLTHIVRESPTLGEPPPPGAVVLFDGTDASQWRNGKLIPAEQFYLVLNNGGGPDRIVDANVLNCGTLSKPAYRDFRLHLEFRTPLVPHATGQGRGNSGVYLQNRYELQVLDSFGLQGLDNECGGIYVQAAPAVNMCFPPLSWQTYDIEFKAARFDAAGKKTADAIVSVWHNGVRVHDHLDLKGSTPAGDRESDRPGPIQLQPHGNPVVYRNIWVIPR